jgi:hypothetical protein
MVTTATPAPEAPVPDSSNSFSRIFGVLFSPKATFASIAARPTWILPVLLGCIIGLSVSFTISKEVGWQTVVEKRIAQSASAQKRIEQLPADQRNNAIAQQAKFTPYFVYPLNVIAPFLGATILTLIFWGAFNGIYGTKLTFSTALGIVSYAWIPQLIYYILSIPILFLKDPATVDIDNILASNPGALLSDDAARWLVALLSSLDIFTIWTLILLAIGFSAADMRKLSFGKAFTVVLLLWLFGVACKVGVAFAFS